MLYIGVKMVYIDVDFLLYIDVNFVHYSNCVNDIQHSAVLVLQSYSHFHNHGADFASTVHHNFLAPHSYFNFLSLSFLRDTVTESIPLTLPQRICPSFLTLSQSLCPSFLTQSQSLCPSFVTQSQSLCPSFVTLSQSLYPSFVTLSQRLSL